MGLLPNGTMGYCFYEGRPDVFSQKNGSKKALCKIKKFTTISIMIIPTIIEKNVGYDIFSRLLKDRIIFVGGREGVKNARHEKPLFIRRKHERRN